MSIKDRLQAAANLVNEAENLGEVTGAQRRLFCGPWFRAKRAIGEGSLCPDEEVRAASMGCSVPQTPASAIARARIGTVFAFSPAMLSRESPTM